MLRSRCVQIFVALGLLTGIGAGGVFAPSQIDQFTGNYALVRDQSRELREAINQATETMNFVLRPIARRQLRQKNIVCSSFFMGRKGESLNINLIGETPLSLPLSGEAVLWKAPDGETVRVHLMSGPELTQIFEAKEGRRENRFTLSPDHTMLTMNVRITSRELPKPVEYQLVYRRV